MNISVDKAGDLKLGKRKCRLHKKEDVVKVAKKYNINTEKKTIKQLCDSIKKKVKTAPMTKDKALTSIDRMNIAITWSCCSSSSRTGKVAVTFSYRRK
jgi:hypothetical protein